MRCYLDRDGVINHDLGYVGTIERFEWFIEIFDIIQLLKGKGYKSFVVITNQSGIGRGYYTADAFKKLSTWMSKEIEEKVDVILEILHCPHTPEDRCNCRKPKTGMFEKFNIGKDDIMIGDKSTDMLAAKRAGIKNRWLISTEENNHYSMKFKDHADLVKMLRTW